VRNVGFSREVREAQTSRRQWLVEQGLAEDEAGSIRFSNGAMGKLRRKKSDRNGAAFPQREALLASPASGPWSKNRFGCQLDRLKRGPSGK
jgi:hypothetical protein